MAPEGGESLGADVMLNALGVGLRNRLRHPERPQELKDQFVALPRFLGQPRSFVREEDGPVGPAGDEAIALQARDRADDRDVRDAEAARQVDGAGFAGGGAEFGDGLDVILGGFGGVLAAGLAEGGGLGLGGADGP